MRNFSVAWERRSEVASGAGLDGGFWIETEWCGLGGGGKSATDCVDSSGGVVVKARVKLRISNLTPQLVRRAAGSLSSLIGSRTLLALIVGFLSRKRCS